MKTNIRAIRANRDNFVRTTLILTDALYNKTNSSSYKLSADLLLYICSFLNFRAICGRRQQGYGLAQFILDNYSTIKETLEDKELSSLRFIEKVGNKPGPLISEQGLFKFSTPKQIPITWERNCEEPPCKKLSMRLV